MKKILLLLCLFSVLKTFGQTVAIELSKNVSCTSLDVYLTPSPSTPLSEVTFTIRRLTACGATVGPTLTSPVSNLVFNNLGSITDGSYTYVGFTAIPLSNFPVISARTLVMSTPIAGSCNYEIMDAPGLVFPNATLNIVNSLGITITGSVTNLADCTAPLPIDLQSFTANKKGTKSLLNWQVASEKNLNLYQLERSTDGVIFSNIFEIKPKAYAVNEKVSYDYTDENPLSGINYYRLKALDKNGEYKYSKVVSLDFGKLLRGKAYPNPFDSDISVEMEISKNAGDVFVEIFDMIGKQVYYKKFAAETERMNVPVPTANLTAGTYIIRVKNGANIWQHKIVKN
jgi:trimeric autotransporter adhesin